MRGRGAEWRKGGKEGKMKNGEEKELEYKKGVLGSILLY